MSFGDFWARFRGAVLEHNWKQIKSYTQFPLHTHGELDWSPKRKIAESKFQPLFERFLEQPNNYDTDRLVAVSEEQQIRKLSAPPPNAHPSSKDRARVADMEFHRTTTDWKLYLIYLNEE